MISTGSQLIAAAGVGIGATLLVDFWNLMLERLFGIASLSYCLLGRWIAHMPSGVFRHRAIRSSAMKPFECTLGWVTHYAIGVGLAAAFALIVAPQWLASPTVGPALLYGILTVALPFFVLQPALGLGVASAAASNPTHSRIKSLATHVVYGLGLYASGLAAAAILGR